MRKFHLHLPSTGVLLSLVCAVLLCSGSAIFGQGLEIPNYHTTLRPFLEKHCISCHGVEKQKGEFRLDILGERVLNEDQAEDWQEVLDLINAGEMPPPDEPQPSRDELTPVLDVLYQSTEAARDAIARRAAGRMRRMNRREYVNTIEDRLGVRPMAETLPVDAGDFGFDTYASDLTVTSAQLEGYLSAGRDAVEQMFWMTIPKAEASPEVREIFGDLSAYGGEPAFELSQMRNEERRQKKRGKRDTLGALPEPPDMLALPIIKRFVEALYQGRIPSETLAPDMAAIFTRGRADGLDFWEALADPMAAALASPNFIYVVEIDEELTQIEVANRLALLLWGAATPDHTLLTLAESGELMEKDAYATQVKRMLEDPRADRFYSSFVDQWLEMERLDLVVIDKDLFPAQAKQERGLKESMRNEVRAFVKELIQSNQPARNLVDSDFTMLDQTLAECYGIPYPQNNESGFQRVPLTGDQQIRGGILGKGAVQMLTSTGARTSPVERGAFILRKLLDRPPPPAPPDVPEVADKPGETSPPETSSSITRRLHSVRPATTE